MFFLQSSLLWALPLVGLPLLIHLLNRQRHRTVPWAAMMFLLDAKRMQRGMAQLRYWLIMAMRMLALAALLFAVARPMSSGLVGQAIGNQSDTVLVLLDHSPSMAGRDANSGKTKYQVGLDKLRTLLQTANPTAQIVLIENARLEPLPCRLADLATLPSQTHTGSSSDVPAMLQSAMEYVVQNQLGQVDIWLVSDLRQHDWQATDGRWQAIRQGFAARDGVRFHLLAYPELPQDNLSVSVSGVQKRTDGDQQQLLLDVRVQRGDQSEEPRRVPLEFIVNGTRSTMEIELTEPQWTLQGHTIPLDATVKSGWGQVAIAGDQNEADNAAYFAFAGEPTRRVTIVAEQAESRRTLEAIASSRPQPDLRFDVQVLQPHQTAEIDWDATSAVIWQHTLPDGLIVDQMTAMLKSGRPVVFFPPTQPDDATFLEIGWSQWHDCPRDQPWGLANMKDDSDLLRKSQSGLALPLAKQQTRRVCHLAGEISSLARLTDGHPLLARAAHGDRLPAYFCTTLPQPEYSSMGSDGVSLYAMLHRAIQRGAAEQSHARRMLCGPDATQQLADWELLSALPADVPSSQHGYHAAVLKGDTGELVSLNRSDEEDRLDTVADAQLEELFAGLEYRAIRDQMQHNNPLANEIWRVFLCLMAIGLIAEAALCLG